MAASKKSLELGGQRIYPRTIASAVTMEDDTTLEYAIKNIPATSIKITGTLATSLGVVDGTSLADLLLAIFTTNTSHVLASAEVLDVTEESST